MAKVGNQVDFLLFFASPRCTVSTTCAAGVFLKRETKGTCTRTRYQQPSITHAFLGNRAGRARMIGSHSIGAFKVI